MRIAVRLALEGCEDGIGETLRSKTATTGSPFACSFNMVVRVMANAHIERVEFRDVEREA